MYTSISEYKIILASSSPRRRELLKELGFTFEVLAADIDETPLEKEHPAAMVLRLAREKAEAVAQKSNDSALVIAADTTVEIDGISLGKPIDAEDAQRILTRIVGREHRVYTGFSIICKKLGLATSRVVESRVELAPLTTQEIAAYVATQEPMDKAGSYAVQGIGAGFVKSVFGSYSNVVGLPLHELLEELKNAGVIRAKAVN